MYRLNRNRSLSVGDVVRIETIDAEDAEEFWACDSYGWRKITEPTNINWSDLYWWVS